MSTLGAEVIREIKRRKQLGRYFDFRGYRELKAINDLGELHAFLRERGFQVEDARRDAIHIVDALQMQQMNKAASSNWDWWLLWWLAIT